MPTRATIIRLVPTAAAFAAAAALVRFAARTVESRVQVAGFVLLALAFEATRRRFGGRPSTIRFAIDSIAAMVAIVAVKWHLEGLPSYLGSFAPAQ